MSELVSVIVPNYNHASWIEQRIHSILGQTYQNFELIILDDCSTDRSKQVIEGFREHPKVRHIIFNEHNSGSTFRQWEKGLSLAHGALIWIAESDDFSDANFLEIAIREISRTGSQLFYCKTVQVDEDGNYTRSVAWWLDDLSKSKWNQSYQKKSSDELVETIIWKNTILNASSVVFKRTQQVKSYLKQVNTFAFAGDWLFWLQYLKDSHSICYSNATTNYWREHKHSTRSVNQFKRNYEILKIYRWICRNILGHEDKKLFTYYYTHHIFKPSRKQMGQQVQLLLNGVKYSKFMLVTTLQYLIQPKSLIVENSVREL